MHRKILFWNKFASAILRIFTSWLLLASFNCLLLENWKDWGILVLLSLAFLLSGIGIYSNKRRAFAGVKAFFIIITILSIYLGMLIMIQNHPLSFGIWEILEVCFILFSISFILTLEIQQKRLKTPIESIPEQWKSQHKQRISAVVVFLVISLLTTVYFFIGKQVQTVPFVPDSYFEKTREKPDLPDVENGYEELRKLIGDIEHPLSQEKEKYSFIYWSKEIGSSINYENNLSPSDEKYLTTPGQRVSSNRVYGQPQERYNTFAEFLLANPDALEIEKVETLKNSDFFPCLIKIVEMERKNTDTTLPKLQNIQAVERVLLRLVGYYADTGDLSTAVDLNILALKLGDKYLSTYSSLVQGLIAIVGTNLATAGTEYLINHHELNTEDRARILETYKNILTTEKETAIRNIFKGEYTAMSEMVRDFDFKSPDEINTIGVNIEPPYLDIYWALILKKPFYDREFTREKYKYAIKESTELVLLWLTPDYDYSALGSQPWNRYNIAGNITLSALLPRLQGSYVMLDRLYQKKDLIVSKLET